MPLNKALDPTKPAAWMSGTLRSAERSRPDERAWSAGLAGHRHDVGQASVDVSLRGLQETPHVGGATPTFNRSSTLGWLRAIATICIVTSCSNPDAPLSRSTSSTTASPLTNISPTAVTPIALNQPSASPSAAAPLRGFPRGSSASAIETALRSVGWTPTGSRAGTVKGVDVTTVLASRTGMTAEVKVFYGYPEGLKDMLELRGTAQGFAEMAMITVIVKDNVEETDRLYEHLMGSPPVRHGSGSGERL